MTSYAIPGLFIHFNVNLTARTPECSADMIPKLGTNAENNQLRPSFMGIGFGSGILLDLVLFADRIIAEPKSDRSILWDIEVCNDLNGVCAFF